MSQRYRRARKRLTPTQRAFAAGYRKAKSQSGYRKRYGGYSRRSYY